MRATTSSSPTAPIRRSSPSRFATSSAAARGRQDFRVIALPKSWLTDPWSALDEAEQPEQWDDRLPILVLPEEPDKLDAAPWPLA